MSHRQGLMGFKGTLHHAAKQGDANMVGLLVEAGANPIQENKEKNVGKPAELTESEDIKALLPKLPVAEPQ